VDETIENKIRLSDDDTEMLKKALEEAAEQASVQPASGTTQFIRKKTESASKSGGNTTPRRTNLI
jgi:hypothetical protein